MKKIYCLLITFVFSLTAVFSESKYDYLKNYSQSTIYDMLCQKNYKVMDAIRQKEINVNLEDEFGYTLLGRACWDCEKETVQFLLENGAKTDAGTRFALYEVCSNEKINPNGEEIIKLLIKYGANVNKKQKKTFNTSLMATLSKQKGKYARLLMDNGASVAVKNIDGETPLMMAIDYCTSDFALINLIASMGSDINAVSKNGDSALSLVCYKGHIDLVKLILNYGASTAVTKKNKNEIPILNACYKGDYSTVKLLMEKGADITVKDSYGNNALLLSCISVDNPLLVDLCIKSGCDVNYKDPSSGNTAFMLATIWNHPKQMKILYDAGANINECNNESDSTLVVILENGIKEANPPYYPANELGGAIYGIELGMNIRVENRYGDSLRKLALQYHNQSKTESKRAEYRKILELIAEKENKFPNVYTFQEAALLGKTDIVKKYLENTKSKINLEEKDTAGRTALYNACNAGNKEIAQLLIKAGAKADNPELLEISVKNKKKEIIPLLVKSGADINYLDRYGYTFLANAIAEGDVDTVEILLVNGANPNFVFKDRAVSYSPICFTMARFGEENKSLRIIELLLKYGANLKVKSGPEYETPFEYASRNDYRKIEALLQK